MTMDSLYREEILEHYKRPHNWGPMESPDLQFSDTNPLCGDELTVMLRTADDGTIEDIHPHDVAEILGRDGVCVRAGHHCAQPLMRRLGAPASSRASFAVHNTHEDVDRLIEGLARVKEVFA